MPENIPVVLIYFLVQDQVVISPTGQIVGLKKDVLLDLLDLYEIPNKREVFERVLKLYAEIKED